MSHSDLLQSLSSGKTPKNIRMLIARGLAPIPPNETLQLLVLLLKDTDSEITSQATQTITAWDEEEILAQLKDRNCAPSVLEHYGVAASPDRLLQAVIANPSSPNNLLHSLARSVSTHLLEAILDNRTRIIEHPPILENIRKNPYVTPEILRLAQEIEFEFLGDKRKEYAVEESLENAPSQTPSLELESEIPLDGLSLEGLPLDEEERQAAIFNRISTMSVREKIHYALFGNREIRAILIRDSNKEVARNVLHSPKLTDNEVESFAAMRNVPEDILREIGNSRDCIKSYSVVHNLVKNPKTPPLISQRLISRLRTQDLTLLTRDRSIPDVVRQNAGRSLKQRAASKQGQ